MSINLTPELEDLIRRKVEAGHYNSAADVIRDGLRLLDEQADQSKSSSTLTPKFGSAKGRVFIADNFDEPLEEFEEYTQ